MSKTLIIGLLAAIVALTAALGVTMTQRVSLRAENERLSVSVDALTTTLDQARADNAAAAELAEVQRRRSVAMAHQIENTLRKQYGGCSDAPIDPDLLHDLDHGLRSQI